MVAVKTFRPGSMSREEFLKEARIMKSLHHPHLVQLYGVCTEQEPIFIVTEFMRDDNLLKYLHSLSRGNQRHRHQTHQTPNLELEEVLTMLAQVSSAMSYLESNNFVHRDLSARNVLVDRGICKVADFGLTRMINDRENNLYLSQWQTEVPVKWTAPEAILFQKHSSKSDVWSFGVLMYEVISGGRSPYPGMINSAVLEAVSRGYRMKRPKLCPRPLYDMMLQTWNTEPEDRPDFSVLLSTLNNMLKDCKTYEDWNKPLSVTHSRFVVNQASR